MKMHPEVYVNGKGWVRSNRRIKSDSELRREVDLMHLARVHGIPLDQDFFTLSASVVGEIVEAAKYWGYRKPKHANGSTARYFHTYMRRVCYK